MDPGEPPSADQPFDDPDTMPAEYVGTAWDPTANGQPVYPPQRLTVTCRQRTNTSAPSGRHLASGCSARLLERTRRRPNNTPSRTPRRSQTCRSGSRPSSASDGGATRDELRSVPLAPCETAEGDQSDQDDDQPDPKAPHEHQDDPDDHDDAAERDACDSTPIIRSSHAFPPPRQLPAAPLLYPLAHLAQPWGPCVNVSSSARSWTLRSSSSRDADAPPRGCRTIRTTWRTPPHRQRITEVPLEKAGPSL